MPMPDRDWTRVDAGLFHAFHHRWIDPVSDAPNTEGILTRLLRSPARAEPFEIPSWTCLTLRFSAQDGETSGRATANPRRSGQNPQPRVRLVRRSEAEIHAGSPIGYRPTSTRPDCRRDRNHLPGQQGDKSGIAHLCNERTAALIQQGVHLLVVHLSPAGTRSCGIKAIWDEFEEEDSRNCLPTALGTCSLRRRAAPGGYREPIAVGDVLPDMPLFLKPG